MPPPTASLSVSSSPSIFPLSSIASSSSKPQICFCPNPTRFTGFASLSKPKSHHRKLTPLSAVSIEKETMISERPHTFLRETDGQDDGSVRSRFQRMIMEVQDSVCAALEAVDGAGKFKEDAWTRPGGGGGISRVLQDGAVFEKAGVNISVVYGVMPPEAYRAAKASAADEKPGPIPFFAAGVSSVLHPKNPFAPTLHFNYRYFETDAPKDAPGAPRQWWFGGGTDLTPAYIFEEDVEHFHSIQKQGLWWFGALGHRVYHRELIPRLVESNWSGTIRHIATSGTHTAAVTETGDLYTWGRDEGDGRLGLGPGRGPNEGGGLSIPTKVKELPTPIATVSCGGFFTMALTEDGQLWNWGANSNYELGRGDKVGGWKPKPIPSLESTRIIQIANGGYHSLALTDDGKVHSWGHGGHGQLGHSSIENQKVPAIVEALAEKRAIYIACGGSSSAAITDEGKLYMWGNARDSQLGVPGLPEVQASPVEVNFLMEDDGLGPLNVLSVAVGACHAMCLVLRSPC